MKHLKFTICSSLALCSFLLVGCKLEAKESKNKIEQTESVKDVREIAWNSLSDSEKEEVVGDWKKAQISKMIANTNGFHLTDKSFEGKEVTRVIFSSKKSSILGDIVKLVDEKTGKVIGGGLRD